MARRPPKDGPDKNRAKAIIIEIVRLSGGKLVGMTALSRAFYFAHLYYAQIAPGFLSDWLMIRLPQGPGIDNARMLLKELQADGLVEAQTVSTGPYRQVEYHTTQSLAPESLPLDAIEAIRQAVEFVKSKTAAELSELTRECARSWRLAKDGEEMNVEADLSTDEEFADRQEAFREMEPIIRKVFGSPVTETTPQPTPG